MKIKVILLALILTACNTSENKNSNEAVTADYFLGSWALSLDYENNKAGWLEIRQEEGYLDADLLWRWGSVSPVEFVFVAEGHLFVTNGRDLIRTRNKEGEPKRVHHAISWLDITKTNDNEIIGIALFPGNDGKKFEKVSFTGKRIPAVGAQPDMETLEFGKEINLLGDDLSGWKLLEPDAVNGWSLKDGILENNPIQKDGEEAKYSGNLRTIDEYEDFNLKLEVKVPAHSNSGVYLKGRYEIQVFDSYGLELDSHNMGALYSRISPSMAAEKPANEWQELDITLVNRYLSVKLNGKTIIDNQPVKGVTGGAISADEFIPGPIYLQGDHGKVSYRNIILKPVI